MSGTPAHWWRRHGDLVLAVGLAAWFVVEQVTRAPSIAHPVGVGVAGAGSALALALRGRSPLASFVLSLSLQGVVAYLSPTWSHESLACLAVLMVNLYSVGARARGTEAWLGLGGVVATVVLVASGDPDHSAGGIAFYVAVCGLPWGAGLALRLRVDRVTELEAHSADLREQAERAVALERARIARELHDVVSHAIAVTVLQARGGRRMIGGDDDAVRRALDAIEHTNTAALTDMRRLLTLLRESDGSAAGRDAPAPSLDRLAALVEEVRAAGLPVDLEVSGAELPLSPGLDLSAYRIVQEALTNVLKHAGPGARARVRIDYGTDDLRLEVRNTGSARPAREPAGHGLLGVRERVGVAGGTVSSRPVPGGYLLAARLPYLADAIEVQEVRLA